MLHFVNFLNDDSILPCEKPSNVLKVCVVSKAKKKKKKEI